LLNQLEQVWAQVQALDQGARGEVRMGFVGSAMQAVIPDLMVRMNKEFPGINFSLAEIAINHQINALQDGVLDIGFVRIDRAPAGMVMLPVEEDHFSLVLPADHPVGPDNFRDMSQFREEHFIMFSSSYSPTYYDTVMSICEDNGFRPRVSHKSVHANTIFRLVECGLGVAIIPDGFRQGFSLNVKFIELLKIPQRTVLSAIWRQDNRNPALGKLVEMLRRRERRD
jgi:DNA-binding transcriptional LysR family regulator